MNAYDRIEFEVPTLPCSYNCALGLTARSRIVDSLGLSAYVGVCVGVYILQSLSLLPRASSSSAISEQILLHFNSPPILSLHIIHQLVHEIRLVGLFLLFEVHLLRLAFPHFLVALHFFSCHFSFPLLLYRLHISS